MGLLVPRDNTNTVPAYMLHILQRFNHNIFVVRIMFVQGNKSE